MAGDELLPSDPAPTVPLEDFSKMNFDFTPDTSQGKIVITVHAQKGASKTYFSFLVATGRAGGFHSGRTVAISFDNKTKITKDQWFPNDNITVHDGKKYYSKDPRTRTKSGNISYEYLQKLLENEQKNGQPDWVILDGFTELAEILEMSMRYINGLKATQGFANRNLWKDRGAMIQKIHDCAYRAARVGVIYTTYSDKDNIVQDGEIITSAEVPKYVDVVMRETDVVIKTTKSRSKDKDIFYAKVETTKYKQYLNIDGKKMPIVEGVTLSQGRTFNITDLADTKPAVSKPIVVDTTTKVEVPIQQVQLVKEEPKKEEKVQEVLKVEEPKKVKEKPKFEIPDIMNI
jgi:hypothetical protein